MKIAVTFGLLALVFGPASAGTVYVSPTGNDAFDGSAARPVRSVARAVELSRAGAGKTVLFADGEYPVPAGVELAAGDAGLVFRAEHPGRATLTGACAVRGWTCDAEDPRLVVAPFPYEPGEWRMPTLVVNGRLAELAAYPEYGGKRRMRYFAEPSEIAKDNRTVIRYDAHDLPSGTDFRTLDVSSAFLYVPQEWCSTRCRIATNDWRNNTFCLLDRTPMPIGQYNQGYQVVNTRLGMDRSGRWMFEAGKRRILYRLRDGEDVATLRATLSRTERLFSLVGTRDIRFEGLVLEGGSAPFRRAKGEPPAACIFGNDSTNVVVEACEVRNASGAGVHFDHEGNITVRKSHFHGLGGCGIWFGYFGEVGEISDCHIHQNGRYSLGDAGAWAHMMHMTVVRNHVHDQPGCGLTLWTCHSLIASNHLHHAMQSIRDGGGLYGAQNFSMIRDNWCHDNGDWSGLYNDEGGRDTVYTGNRFDGSWWPFHMHDTYGIVVTNNVFTCDGRMMRLSFQGSTHAVFRDNVLNVTIPVTEAKDLDCCDVWADNDIRVKGADGVYRSVGRLSFERRPAPPKGPAEAVAAPGSSMIFMDRDAKGLSVAGVPGARARLSHDGTNLVVEGFYEYNKFISYEGSVRLGETWGRHDAVRFCFDGFEVTAFVGTRVVSSDPTLKLDPKRTYSEKMKSVGDGWARFGFAIPLARLGDGRFNAIFYNADHDEYKYFTPPADGNVASGRIVLRPYEPDCGAKWDLRKRRLEGFGDLPGVAYPGGHARMAPVTVDRTTAGARSSSGGYDIRHSDLAGFVQGGDGVLEGFLLLPYAGDDPADGAAFSRSLVKAGESSRPDRYGVFLDDWTMQAELTASADATWLHFVNDRGGVVKLLLDAGFVRASGKGAEDVRLVGRQGSFADNAFEGHVRADVGGRLHDLYCKMSFNPAPSVRELKDGRTVLSFGPGSGNVTVRVATSANSAEEAARRLTAEPAGLDFKSVRAAARDAWNKTLHGGAMSPDFLTRGVVVSDTNQFTCGSAPTVTVSEDGKTFYTPYLTSTTGFGECHDIAAVAEFPVTDPKAANSHVICNLGESFCGMTVSSVLSFVSFPWKGNVRVTLDVNYGVCGWRDWDPKTKCVVGEGRYKCRFAPGAKAELLTPEALTRYLNGKGYVGHNVNRERGDRLLCGARPCWEGKAFYGTATSSWSQPVLYRCEDGETFDFLGVVPEICQYECPVTKHKGVFYAFMRGSTNDNFFVSRDGGRTFKASGRLPDGKQRPQLQVWRGKVLLTYSAPDEKPSIVRNGRNNLHMLWGEGDDLAKYEEILHAVDPLGIVYYDIVDLNGKLHILWSNAGRFPTHVKWGAVQGKDQILYAPL